MRGNGLLRSIPTCVGLTINSARQRSFRNGPSPRAWGSPRCRPARGRRGRSIPTCVGLTACRQSAAFGEAVHPHVRGAHGSADQPAVLGRGPSPRAWGSHRHGDPNDSDDRSIPTCVGLTESGIPSKTVASVHPHVRGAHTLTMGASKSMGGPSPRAWGSLASLTPRRRRARSIPTCVGLTLQGHPT